MKASNQKVRTAEFLKFLGILLGSILLTSTLLYSNLRFPQSENQRLQEEIEVLEAELIASRNREIQMAALIKYIDSAYTMIQDLSRSEMELIQLQTQGLAGEFEKSEKLNAINFKVIDIKRLIQNFAQAERDTFGIILTENLNNQVKNKVVNLYDVILREKELKRTAILGNDEQENAELAALNEMLEQKEQQIQNQQVQMQFENQQQQLSSNLQQAQSSLTSCQSSLTAAKGKLIRAKSFLSQEYPNVQFISEDILAKTNQLSGLIVQIRGYGDKGDKAKMEQLVAEYNQMADQLQRLASNMSGLTLQLE